LDREQEKEIALKQAKEENRLLKHRLEIEKNKLAKVVQSAMES